ncbi:type IX secretion system outer membrane channel protein PorV [Persicobacter sp. CCB-QB2]|uniref:type IX secretion system outer membrane channel protein PorV n=1 Tax=Persicobacter sp. CCB-QB2 TaxID=1561025 RepID=UPI00092E92A0|nr:type IX secretion system outer membrane channel protein PorV [Persicobacter sp. CCB-QB2]
MKKLNYIFSFLIALAFSPTTVFAQNIGPGGPNASGQQGGGVIQTAVPFMLISPDARSAGLGDMGAATSADLASAYWNPGKYAFIENDFAASLSYTPWLGKITNDMSISYLSGYYKLTREQLISVSLTYFNMGTIEFVDENGQTNLPQGRPRDYNIQVGYSRMLSESSGIGVNLKYIRSNLGASAVNGDIQPAQSVAADIGYYYNKKFKRSLKKSELSFGAVISNIGAKMTYLGEAEQQFLPANLRLGSVYSFNLDPYNKLCFGLEFNKLMVPTPTYDEDGNKINNQDKSVINGMFSSFGDAPNGFGEEIQEVKLQASMEYWYKELFAARLGYQYEDPEKGDRTYMTLGLGFYYNVFGLDVAYLVPFTRENPLAETIRFTLSFQFGEESTTSVRD